MYIKYAAIEKQFVAMYVLLQIPDKPSGSFNGFIPIGNISVLYFIINL